MKKPYTEEDIAQAKAKYPHVVRELIVYPSETEFDKDGKPSEEPAYFLIKKPSKALVYMANSAEFKGKEQDLTEAIITNCVIKGDLERADNDASIFSGLNQKLSELINSTRVELKKV